MKKARVINVIVLISEILLIYAVGFILYYLNFARWINFFIYVILLVEILWVLKKSYDNYDPYNDSIKTLPLSISNFFWLIFIFLDAVLDIPYTIMASHSFCLSYLFAYGCCISYKKNKKKYIKYIAIIWCGIVIFSGMLCLLGVITNFR